MKLPPFWKVKREITRLIRDIVMFPLFVINFFLSTPHYDLFLSRKRNSWDGQQAWSDRIAVFVIYPSGGLLESHLVTLRHLVDNGYSTIVVSNLPLPDADRVQVLNLCANYIERPNYGYDFGAYRDGVLSVKDRLPQLQRFVLVNDSVWYPLPGKRNWLREAEQMGFDFVGASTHLGTKRGDLRNFREFEWQYSPHLKNFHYTSFALSFGPNILRSPEFVTFWENFRLANKKNRVVRRGEIGVTKWVLTHGFSHGCMYNPDNLPNDLHDLDDDRLSELVANVVILDSLKYLALKKEVERIPRSDPDWRRTMQKFVLLATAIQGSSYAIADFLIQDRGYPFMKKASLRYSRDAADASIRLLDKLSMQEIDHVKKEARKLGG